MDKLDGAPGLEVVGYRPCRGESQRHIIGGKSSPFRKPVATGLSRGDGARNVSHPQIISRKSPAHFVLAAGAPKGSGLLIDAVDIAQMLEGHLGCEHAGQAGGVINQTLNVVRHRSKRLTHRRRSGAHGEIQEGKAGSSARFGCV